MFREAYGLPYCDQDFGPPSRSRRSRIPKCLLEVLPPPGTQAPGSRRHTSGSIVPRSAATVVTASFGPVTATAIIFLYFSAYRHTVCSLALTGAQRARRLAKAPFRG